MSSKPKVETLTHKKDLSAQGKVSPNVAQEHSALAFCTQTKAHLQCKSHGAQRFQQLLGVLYLECASTTLILYKYKNQLNKLWNEVGMEVLKSTQTR